MGHMSLLSPFYQTTEEKKTLTLTSSLYTRTPNEGVLIALFI